MLRTLSAPFPYIPGPLERERRYGKSFPRGCSHCIIVTLPLYREETKAQRGYEQWGQA